MCYDSGLFVCALLDISYDAYLDGAVSFESSCIDLSEKGSVGNGVLLTLSLRDRNSTRPVVHGDYRTGPFPLGIAHKKTL